MIKKIQFRSFVLRIVLLLAVFVVSAAEVRGAKPFIVDGTFLLRSRKAALDNELRARMAVDPKFSARLSKIARIFGAWSVGDANDFQSYNFASGQYETRKSHLKLIGSHCYIFVADDSQALLGTDPSGTLNQIKTNFDDKVYPSTVDWFGSVNIPPSFNLPDDKIYLLMLDIKDGLGAGYVAGYFDSRDLESFGNQKPLFFMDLNPGKPGDPTDKNNDFYKTLAHEFQHMINYSKHLARSSPQEDRWIEEGLSGFSEFIYTALVKNDGIGLPPSPHLSRFLENPDLNLTQSTDSEWFGPGTLFRHYGASFLYIYYLQEKYGGADDSTRKTFVRKLVDNGAVGINGLNSVLAEKNTTFIESLKNWFVANHLNDISLNGGMWGYTDKDKRLGADGAGIPIKGVSHFFSSSGLSFLGGEGEVLPNAGRYLDISGSNKVILNFKGDPNAFTPFVATIDLASQTAMRDIILGASSTGSIGLEFSTLRKVVLIPAVATTASNVSSRFFYQFSGQPSKLILYPIPNPAFTKDVIIVVKSNGGALAATPTVVVKFNNISSSPNPQMTPTDPERNVFVGNYHIPPGSGEGVVTASIGEDTSTFTFHHSELSANLVSKLQVKEAQFTISSRVEGDQASLFETSLSDAEPELRVLSKPYYAVFNSQNAIEAKLLFEGSSYPIDRESQLGLWSGKNLQGAWLKVSRNERGFFSPITREGTYVLVADTVAPKINDLHIEEFETKPTLLARVSDNGSGVNRDSIRVEVNGESVPFAFDNGTGQVSADLSRLPQGSHRFSIELSDNAENLGRAILQQTLAGPLRVMQATAYPNPARAFTTVAVILDGSGADDPTLEIEAKIYDSAGHKVTTFPLSYKSNHTFATRWDCRAESSRTVANGLYPFKIIIRKGGDELKANGTLAVLR